MRNANTVAHGHTPQLHEHVAKQWRFTEVVGIYRSSGDLVNVHRVVARNSGDLLNFHRNVAKGWGFAKFPLRFSNSIDYIFPSLAREWRFTKYLRLSIIGRDF